MNPVGQLDVTLTNHKPRSAFPLTFPINWVRTTPVRTNGVAKENPRPGAVLRYTFPPCLRLHTKGRTTVLQEGKELGEESPRVLVKKGLDPAPLKKWSDLEGSLPRHTLFFCFVHESRTI